MTGQLIKRVKKTSAPTCVGLDPVLPYVLKHVIERSLDTCGETLEGVADAIWQFNKGIIDHIFGLTSAVKLQIAMYEQFGIEGLTVYRKTVGYCHEKGLIVIGDTRRGDIGPTSAAYAAGYFSRVQAGSGSLSGSNASIFTVNPYLGTDGIKSFVDVCKNEDKGLFVLVKTSSPFNEGLQDRLINGRPFYERVATKMEEWGSDCMDGGYSNAGAAVNATCPEMSGVLGKLMPRTYFPVPGYGAQEGTTADPKHCSNQDGFGVVANSPRGIIAAYKQEKYKNFGPEHFGEASRQTAIDMTADISGVL